MHHIHSPHATHITHTHAPHTHTSHTHMHHIHTHMHHIHTPHTHTSHTHSHAHTHCSYYWEDEVLMRAVNAEFVYGYEYLGNTGRR